MIGDSNFIKTLLVWIKKWWVLLCVVGAIATGIYYWGDIQAARNANQIAKLSITPRITIIATEVSYGMGLNSAYLQQISGRRIVVRLANIGNVQTSLTSIEFSGYIKALRQYNLPKKDLKFSYGKPAWEPFNGYSSSVWSEEVPAFQEVLNVNVQHAPWKKSWEGEQQLGSVLKKLKRRLEELGLLYLKISH